MPLYRHAWRQTLPQHDVIHVIRRLQQGDSVLPALLKMTTLFFHTALGGPVYIYVQASASASTCTGATTCVFYTCDIIDVLFRRQPRYKYMDRWVRSSITCNTNATLYYVSFKLLLHLHVHHGHNMHHDMYSCRSSRAKHAYASFQLPNRADLDRPPKHPSPAPTSTRAYTSTNAHTHANMHEHVEDTSTAKSRGSSRGRTGECGMRQLAGTPARRPTPHPPLACPTCSPPVWPTPHDVSPRKPSQCNPPNSKPCGRGMHHDSFRTEQTWF